MQEIFQWIIGGIAGASVILLSAIWAETRKNTERLQDICIKFAAIDNTVDMHKKVIDKLPCINNVACNLR